MNWDQIESNWAAMARRVRPERLPPEISGTAAPPAGADGTETAVDEPERIAAEVSSASRQVA